MFLAGVQTAAIYLQHSSALRTEDQDQEPAWLRTVKTQSDSPVTKLRPHLWLCHLHVIVCVCVCVCLCMCASLCGCTRVWICACGGQGTIVASFQPQSIFFHFEAFLTILESANGSGLLLVCPWDPCVYLGITGNMNILYHIQFFNVDLGD